jgi:hypothetical protein
MLRVIVQQLLPAMEATSLNPDAEADGGTAVRPDVWTYNLALKAAEVSLFESLNLWVSRQARASGSFLIHIIS